MGVTVGAIVTSGTGYYYPPYIAYPVGGYPIYRPYPTAYGAYGSTAYYRNGNGAYGISQTAYGPYGAANRTASYNPYTGTSARTASAATPFGRQSVGRAYNPYTGSYGATRQGASPTAQWGQSYVSQGNRSATTQHYSNAYGTTASARGSQGGKAVATSAGPGRSAAYKTSSGDMYAGHDGNVYKNTGSGWKQSNGSGGWNDVAKTTNSSQYRPSGTTSTQSLNSDRRNRMSGSTQAQRSGGGSFGGGGRGRRGR